MTDHKADLLTSAIACQHELIIDNDDFIESLKAHDIIIYKVRFVSQERGAEAREMPEARPSPSRSEFFCVDTTAWGRPHSGANRIITGDKFFDIAL